MCRKFIKPRRIPKRGRLPVAPQNEAYHNHPRQQDHARRRQIDGIHAPVTDQQPGHRPGNAQPAVKEGRVQTKRRTLVLRLHFADGLHPQCREDQREAAAGQEGAKVNHPDRAGLPDEHQTRALHRKRHQRDADGAIARDAVVKQQAHQDKADAEQRQGECRSAPVVAGEIEGDEGSNRAKAHGPEAKAQTVQPDFAKHAGEGNALPDFDLHRRATGCQPVAENRHQNN